MKIGIVHRIIFLWIVLLFLISTTTITKAQIELLPAAFATTCCLLYIFIFIIWIVIAIWAYKDAEQRGESGALWVIIILIIGIIGLIIWLIVRPPIGGKKEGKTPRVDRRCPDCGRQIPIDALMCPYCGKNFASKNQKIKNSLYKRKMPEFCTECGNKFEENEKYCSNCGAERK
jgi:hypothetical protein